MLAVALLPLAAAFSSVDLGRAGVHDQITSTAWRLLDRQIEAAEGGCAARRRLGFPTGFRKEQLNWLNQRADGVEVMHPADQLFLGRIGLDSLLHDFAANGRYDPSHHFDRSDPDAPSAEAFLAGAAWYQGELRAALADAESEEPARRRRAPVHLMRAIHALQDAHAHSNLAELASVYDLAAAAPSLAPWLKLVHDRVRDRGGPAWYAALPDGGRLETLQAVDACLTPGGTTCRGEALPWLRVTWFPPAEGLDVGAGPGCLTGEEYACYAPRAQRMETEPLEDPVRCAHAWRGARENLPSEMTFYHDCFAKDTAKGAFESRPDRRQRRKEMKAAHRRAVDLAAIRTAATLAYVRKTLGPERWSALLDAARQLKLDRETR